MTGTILLVAVGWAVLAVPLTCFCSRLFSLCCRREQDGAAMGGEAR